MSLCVILRVCVCVCVYVSVCVCVCVCVRKAGADSAGRERQLEEITAVGHCGILHG